MSGLAPRSIRGVRGVGRLEHEARRAIAWAFRRAGRLPQAERAHWFGASSPRDASRALALRASGLVRDAQSWVLTIGDGGSLQQEVDKALAARGTTVRSADLTSALGLSGVDTVGLVCVVCAEPSASKATEVARELLHHDALSGIPLEYVSGLEPEREQFRRHDEYGATFFMSPVQLAEPSPYDIYEASLDLFEQKCGLRDYLDLYQVLCSIERRGVPGSIAEFGSYRGHSGWLIARTLEVLGSQRRLFMFDTFDSFPEEPAGVDYFWSKTHDVSHAEVVEKLGAFHNVELVRGDFTDTLPATDVGLLAMAYVDCDSYRAVSYVADATFENLAPGGVMLFEDYGHPALLGCRVAVHERFDGRTDCFQFLSQFSGVYMVIKPDRSGTN